jgi:Flp pilus assembly pilin Flp
VAAEYALLITLIALVIIIGAGALGVAINNQLNAAADALP